MNGAGFKELRPVRRLHSQWPATVLSDHSNDVHAQAFNAVCLYFFAALEVSGDLVRAARWFGVKLYLFLRQVDEPHLSDAGFRVERKLDTTITINRRISDFNN